MAAWLYSLDGSMAKCSDQRHTKRWPVFPISAAYSAHLLGSFRELTRCQKKPGTGFYSGCLGASQPLAQPAGERRVVMSQLQLQLQLRLAG